MRSLLKNGLLSAISLATRRSAVLLATEASRENAMLSIAAPYRADDDRVTMQILEPMPGTMELTLNAGGTGNAAACRFAYEGPGTLILNLRDGVVTVAGLEAGSISDGQAITARRFALHFHLLTGSGATRRRTTSHYIPRDGHDVDRAYFSGEDYVDYEAESAGVHAEVLERLHRHQARGPVLEIGCATGGTMAALRDAGFDAYGVDVSAWAVDQTRARVGDVVWQCDVEREALPAALVQHGPFGCFVLASVLEHFEHPMRVLAKVDALAAPAATLVMLTTNGDSLTRRIFGRDWEGYFDWTHKGVDAVTPQSIRGWLADLGWSIRELRTWHVWDGSGDPAHATVRDWHAADARFRTMLAERELGDFIACVAVRA